MSVGIYVSVPFCRTKCSYCNFASDVFSRAVFERYVDRVCEDVASAPKIAAEMSGDLERSADSIHLGGGTPTVLESGQLERIFAALRNQFAVEGDAEITVECAPGTLTGAMLSTLLRCGVNRVSLGVQSFVDQEAASVGRQHKRATVLEEIQRLRSAGIANINIDLIAGLPHQSPESWDFSVAEAIASGVPHVSVYMLEVDEDSRLGSEVLAGGTRYDAHFVPNEEAVADFYLTACERLKSAGVAQYEISNFALEGYESRHNLKYWTRQSYFGFGVDAHSMLKSFSPGLDATRFAQADSLEQYVRGAAPLRTEVTCGAALEESLFLGLRLNRGVDLNDLEQTFGAESMSAVRAAVHELIGGGMVEQEGTILRLTARGRLLSNEVFERLLVADDAVR